MKIALIGSSQYQDKFKAVKRMLELKNHTVRIPNFDDFNGNEIEMCMENKKLIEWAERIHIIWDGRSIGTIFDFGMVFAMNKPIKIEYIEPKKIENIFIQYEELHKQSNLL